MRPELMKAGYVSNARGSLLPHFAQGSHSPLSVTRLSLSYLWRLPGAGRKRLRKLRRERLYQVQNTTTRPPRR